jgi:DNA-binding NarL/FixJ family response regulator
VGPSGESCEACGKPIPAGLDALAADHRLTRRELQVAWCAASGSTNQEIAEHLCVSARTVEGHLQRCYEKLGLHSRTRLAVQLHSAARDVHVELRA